MEYFSIFKGIDPEIAQECGELLGSWIKRISRPSCRSRTADSSPVLLAAETAKIGDRI